MVFLSALVGVGGLVYLAGQGQAQTPGGGAPPAAAPRAGGKVAVFNVAKVMKDYKRWQHFAKVMNDKRAAESAGLAKLRNEIAELQAKGQAMPANALKTDVEAIQKAMLEKQRQFEDRERQVRTALDGESAGYLRNLFAEIQQAVKAIVDTNGFDLVLAYPDAITAEEMTSPLYYDLKLRPPAAMPFYVSPSIDMTDVLIQTLNTNFKPPAEVAPVGGVAPAGAPPGGGVVPTPGAPPGRPGGM
jgi:Skp family chaperone for outer membrane proteins